MAGDPALTFAADGAELHAGAAASLLPDLEAALVGLPDEQAGIRLHGIPALAALLRPHRPIGALAAQTLGAEARPVRALLFDKTAATNWTLGWHQDRTIVVQERVDVPGFGPWTNKSGLQHVAPPFALLEAMVTLRIHLDPIPADNAPLLVAPGSHRLGRIAEDRIDAVVARCGTAACLAEPGDVWRYATPILHASAAGNGSRRRVLQVDYAAVRLPGGLRWLGL
jgi:hypothetical protein